MRILIYVMVLFTVGSCGGSKKGGGDRGLNSDGSGIESEVSEIDQQYDINSKKILKIENSLKQVLQEVGIVLDLRSKENILKQFKNYNYTNVRKNSVDGSRVSFFTGVFEKFSDLLSGITEINPKFLRTEELQRLYLNLHNSWMNEYVLYRNIVLEETSEFLDICKAYTENDRTTMIGSGIQVEREFGYHSTYFEVSLTDPEFCSKVKSQLERSPHSFLASHSLGMKLPRTFNSLSGVGITEFDYDSGDMDNSFELNSLSRVDGLKSVLISHTYLTGFEPRNSDLFKELESLHIIGGTLNSLDAFKNATKLKKFLIHGTSMSNGKQEIVDISFLDNFRDLERVLIATDLPVRCPLKIENEALREFCTNNL